MIDPRRLCQMEIQVRDLERARAFYENVFGWRIVPAEVHGYLVCEVPDDCPFGITLVAKPAAAPREGAPLVLYFAVDEPQEVVARLGEWGGRLHLGPMLLPGYGEIYQLDDPDGHRFGLFRKRPGPA